MSDPSDLGPELRRLAQAILDRLDPAVRAAAAMAGDAMRGPGSCQQVWCPVCALAALIAGEQHPLLNVISEHSVSLLAVIQSMVADPHATAGAGEPPADSGGAGEAEEAGDTRGETDPPVSSNVRFHRIPIVVEDGSGQDAEQDIDA